MYHNSAISRAMSRVYTYTAVTRHATAMPSPRHAMPCYAFELAGCCNIQRSAAAAAAEQHEDTGEYTKFAFAACRHAVFFFRRYAAIFALLLMPLFHAIRHYFRHATDYYFAAFITCSLLPPLMPFSRARAAIRRRVADASATPCYCYADAIF